MEDTTPQGALEEDETRRARALAAAEELALRLDRPMGALGVLFLFVVLAQTLTEGGTLARVLTVSGWVLWGVFVCELALRAVVAQDQRRFWRRNWWQVLFLAVPFLRFARALTVVRAARLRHVGRITQVGRLGGVLTSAVRGSRSAGRLLSGRVGWLAVVTGVVVLASSQLLYLVGSYDRYVDALHAAALATVTGESFRIEDGFARALEVVLATYSVAVFATLAGALGAYFLEKPRTMASPVASAPTTDDALEGTG